jgi:hypothetical protein
MSLVVEELLRERTTTLTAREIATTVRYFFAEDFSEPTGLKDS